MAGNDSRSLLWGIWLVATVGLLAWMAHAMLKETDSRTLFMPGALSDGHHQLQSDCAACHTDPLGGGEVLQEACIDCHGEDRKKPVDSHPRAKFQDPRNADRLENIDALHCVTCHSEHRPEITRKNGVTQPADLCVHCHRDIAEDRPSHRDMAFTTCTDSGCHNFHNNRALYTKFLIKHLDEPPLLSGPVVPERGFVQVIDEITEYPLERYPVRPLAAEQADDPVDLPHDASLLADWSTTAHARSGVNCSACHVARADNDAAQPWNDHPGEQACGDCHRLEVERFMRGKHGMRLAAGLQPMQVSNARLPMHADAAHRTLTCSSCHAAHRFDTGHAAAEACMDCHTDDHSVAYRESPHYTLWQKELAGELPAGSGVSCATCHMPRIEFDFSEWSSRIMVDHNQSANLSPNSKMIRTTCLQCHGLGFSLDALADRQLVDNNFSGRPSVHVRTMELAAAEKTRRDSEADNDDTSMFGF